MINRVTAVFDTESQAEKAVSDLRREGVDDKQLSIVSRQGRGMAATGEGTTAEAAEETKDTGERAGKGALAGAGVGAIFGLAASLIPGVGPFITAGWLANLLGAVGGGIASGAIVGGTAGAVAGALAKAGYEEDEARFYGDAVERGNVLVAVDTANSDVSADRVRVILLENGGRFDRDQRAERAA